MHQLLKTAFAHIFNHNFHNHLTTMMRMRSTTGIPLSEGLSPEVPASQNFSPATGAGVVGEELNCNRRNLWVLCGPRNSHPHSKYSPRTSIRARVHRCAGRRARKPDAAVCRVGGAFLRIGASRLCWPRTTCQPQSPIRSLSTAQPPYPAPPSHWPTLSARGPVSSLQGGHCPPGLDGT